MKGHLHTCEYIHTCILHVIKEEIKNLGGEKRSWMGKREKNEEEKEEERRRRQHLIAQVGHRLAV